MEITIHNATKIVTLNGIDCRIWEGVTAGGVPVHCYIPRVAVSADESVAVHAEFERELRAVAPPSEALESIPLRMII